MDESEALCDRLAIMARGQLMCLGDVQRLKKKFRKGFAVRMKLQVDEALAEKAVRDLKDDMNSTFPRGRIEDEHQVYLEYRIDDRDLSWSFLFKSMQNIKKKHALVDDYVISETTLEEIFLGLGENT